MPKRSAWIVWPAVYAIFVLAGCLPQLSSRAMPSATATQPLLTPTAPASAPATPAAVDSFRVLVFSKTAGFRHASIPDGIAAIQQIGAEHNFAVDATEDAARFTDTGLANYRVVIFLNTTGDVLNEEQQAAFERFVQDGGGFVGVHSATDTEYDWPWYGALVGAYFDSHPAIQPATLQVVDANHPSTSDLPTEWPRTDEWYNFRDRPAPGVNILLQIDETTYDGGTMGDNHPLAWYHAYDGGRAWYTAMGHTSESYREPLFQTHLAGGILWAAGDPTMAQVILPLLIR